MHPSWEDFYATFKALPGPKRLIAFSKFARRHYAEEVRTGRGVKRGGPAQGRRQQKGM